MAGRLPLAEAGSVRAGSLVGAGGFAIGRQMERVAKAELEAWLFCASHRFAYVAASLVVPPCPSPHPERPDGLRVGVVVWGNDGTLWEPAAA